MLVKLNNLERLALMLCGLLIALGGGLYLYQSNTPSASPTGQLGGNFTLQASDGPVSLADFSGRGVVIMFGYSACPDVCPTGLATIGAALNRLPDALQQQVQPLFISVDPARDTTDKLDQYSRYFHPAMIGLTGSKADIDAVVSAYGAFYRRVELPNSAMQYGIDHSTRIYLIDRDGQLVRLLHHNTPVAELAAAILTLLQGA